MGNCVLKGSSLTDGKQLGPEGSFPFKEGLCGGSNAQSLKISPASLKVN